MKRRGRADRWERQRLAARRAVGRRLYGALDADERTFVEVFMSDGALRMLAGAKPEEAREYIRHLMDGMAQRGYTMDGLADCFKGGGDDE